MNKLNITFAEIKELYSQVELDFPKYTTQIMNLANQNAQGTRRNVVGQMSELIEMFGGNSIEEWETGKRYLTLENEESPESNRNYSRNTALSMKIFKSPSFSTKKIIIETELSLNTNYETHWPHKFVTPTDSGLSL